MDTQHAPAAVDKGFKKIHGMRADLAVMKVYYQCADMLKRYFRQAFQAGDVLK